MALPLRKVKKRAAAVGQDQVRAKKGDWPVCACNLRFLHIAFLVHLGIPQNITDVLRDTRLTNFDNPVTFALNCRRFCD